ncbi:NAD(P)/FAD-dependent oxidoreductase [Shimia sp.]|uniref:NAD(P)/FAD-dependent oxidoreductase n=1 Tax=Shimia sp. TaxID=1954381 RepID=UPI003563793A
MDKGDTLPIWQRSSDEPGIVSPLQGDGRCDVAIIGGGYTGLSTALHGAEMGLDCHVLEAGSIGAGGSGRNVGYVNAGLWLPPQDVYARLGEDLGRRLVTRLGAMPDYVFSLVDRHRMQCDAQRNGTLHAAHAPSGQRNLKRRAEGWQALGAPVELLGPDAAAEMIGTRRFHGALWDHRAGVLDPVGYARGLARAAIAAGARVSTGARVTALRREDGLWQLRTAEGALLRAQKVVLATNAYSDDLWPGLGRTFTPIQFFQLATVPLGARAAHILPGGQGVWDTAPVMFVLRRDAAGRLIIGSMGALYGGMEGLSRRWAARQLRRLFPDLGPVDFESAWQGQIAMTPDHVFRIHRLDEGLYAPIGYNGRGITTGTMFGQALAELLSGGDAAALPVPVSAPKPVVLRGAMAGFYQSAFAAMQILRSL